MSINSENILSNLNDSQRMAVEYCDGPQLVIAGAGAGKTRVLTHKIAYLLFNGWKPWNILALTFTNKAAREMEARIKVLVGDKNAKGLNMGTFHSLMASVLRREASYFGYKSNYTIYDESDSRSLLKAITKEMSLDEKKYKPAVVHSVISMAKNNCIDAMSYGTNRSEMDMDNEYDLGKIGEIYHLYESRLRQANAMDFDDLLLKAYHLFRDNDEIRKQYSDKYKYILIDEYQDTNYVQQQIVYLLSGRNGYVCAVGDDYQSIYAFRGARIDNILKFRSLFDDCKLFKLERNYRSTKMIVAAANSLMKHNKNQIDKDVYSDKADGELVDIVEACSDKEEVAIVCKEINKATRHDSVEYKNIAILYRTNAQSRLFEDELRAQNIPYRIYGGLSFYQRKEIKDIVAYFKLVCNPDDEEALKRIINYPARGIGDTTISKIIDRARAANTSLWDVICDIENGSVDVNKGTITKLINFRNLIAGFIEQTETVDAFELGKEIIMKSGVSAEIYSGTDPDDVSRQENVEQLINGLSDFVADRREQGEEEHALLTDYLQLVSLMTDADNDDGSDNKVTLMTIHSAKGLEYDTVFVVGLEENLFPGQKSLTSLARLEEERRLLYVAITRAERKCFLTWSQKRWRYGMMEYERPSRFLKDISIQYVSKYGDSFASDYNPDLKSIQRRPVHLPLRSSSNLIENTRMRSNRMTIIPRESKGATDNSYDGDLKIGTRISHMRFGVGTITNLEGRGENAKATVEFDNAGTKQLLLKFAKITIIH